MPLPRPLWTLCLVSILAACSGSIEALPDAGIGSDLGESPDAGSPPDALEAPDGAASDLGTAADAGTDSGAGLDALPGLDAAPGLDATPGDGASVDAGPPPSETCTPPIGLTDTNAPDRTVGTGTPESCTRAALASAVAQGGVIVFDCGPKPVTIAISETIQIPTDRDTVIDGEDRVTLDGQGATRIFQSVHPNYRVNTNTIVLQRLRFVNARAQGTNYIAQDPNAPECAYGYADGGGGAILVRDMILHVIGCHFEGNRAASPGPDVGGGAIYALGALDVTVVGSTFLDNQGSNGGAVGLLQTTGRFVNSVFANNSATGTGQNYVRQGCPGVGHANQGGAGGNGGALSIDGADDLEQYFCGVHFRGNHANELGGCVFRTANGAQRRATFLRATLDGNRAEKGGGCLYISNSELTIAESLVANNVVAAGSGGGVRTELGSIANIVNTTFYNNASLSGLMGALSHNGGGEIRNCTFAANKAEGGPGLFTAALGPAGAVQVFNTIFWNNTTTEPYNPQACWFEPKSGSNNLQWPRKRYGGSIDDTACVTGVRWEDADLGALDDNGGPTLSLMPNAGSAAVGAGAGCPSTDQRGQPRPSDGCTAGAIEP